MAAHDPRTGHLVPGSFTIVTSGVSLARQLWRYGEPALAERAARLTAAEVVDVGIRAGEMADGRLHEVLWSSGPRYSAASLVLAVIELLEGEARRPRRDRRLPEKQLPPSLQLSEAELWEAGEPVRAELDGRGRGR